ncbi:MAG: tyrosine-type recombinase/integrase [Ruminococcus sp.]
MAELVTRKRGTKWEYRFQVASVNGKRQYKSKSGFKTKAEALEAGTKALNEYNLTGFTFTPSEISFADYLDLWLDTYCKTNHKATTVTNYEKKIRLYIKPVLGNYKLKNLNAVVLQNFVNEKFHEGLSRNTLSVIKGILSNSMSYAVQPLQFIQYSPMLYVKLPSARAIPEKPSRSAEHFLISEIDMERIFIRFPQSSSAYLPLLLGYKCGLRLGEAFAITWDCIDFEKKELTVNKQVQWHEKLYGKSDESYWYITPPKYNSSRTIAIDDELVDFLQNLKIEQEENKRKYAEFHVVNYVDDVKKKVNQANMGTPTDFVNVRECGEFIQPRIMQHTSHIIHEELGINFTFHSLRHTHCSMLLSAGASVKYVQQRLGHKNVQITMQVYQHLTKDMDTKGNAVLNSIFKKEE